MIQANDGAILELREVEYRYPNGCLGLDRCSVSFRRGVKSALLGLNGAGKTTLFLHCNAVLRPLTGQIFFDGSPLDYGRQGLRGLRSRVGLVFQNPDSQLFSASVREDVSFGPMNLGLPVAEVRERVEQALAAVGMSDCAERPAHAMSYGQKKRVCIAGVLAMAPEVLILDEPMAGLDASMRMDLTGILERLHDDGMTIIIATHDIDFAYQWADRIDALEAGRCVASWNAADLPLVTEELKRLRIGVPKVAELHRLLVESGLAPTTEPPPRSHEQLLERLAGLRARPRE